MFTFSKILSLFWYTLKIQGTFCVCLQYRFIDIQRVLYSLFHQNVKQNHSTICFCFHYTHFVHTNILCMSLSLFYFYMSLKQVQIDYSVFFWFAY